MFRALTATAFVLALTASGAAHAGPYADDVAKCFQTKMNDADRTSVVVWLFAELSANPALKPMTNISEAQLTDARKSFAAASQRLITEDCRAQAAAALRNEGGGVLLGTLGAVAQASIGFAMRDPAVVGNMQQIGQYFDTAKLAAIMTDPAGDKK